jgi:hypothetical protein
MNWPVANIRKSGSRSEAKVEALPFAAWDLLCAGRPTATGTSLELDDQLLVHSPLVPFIDETY